MKVFVASTQHRNHLSINDMRCFEEEDEAVAYLVGLFNNGYHPEEKIGLDHGVEYRIYELETHGGIAIMRKDLTKDLNDFNWRGH